MWNADAYYKNLYRYTREGIQPYAMTMPNIELPVSTAMKCSCPAQEKKMGAKGEQKALDKRAKREHDESERRNTHGSTRGARREQWLINPLLDNG